MSTNRSTYPSLLPSSSGLSPGSYGSVNGNHNKDIEQAILEGISMGGRISVARRLFILMTVFDLLFTFLIWIISIVVSSDTDINTAFKNEVLNYNVQTSMFDVVILALARLILIVLLYVFIRISHYWMVAVTTAGTTAFIISKVFLYKWAHTTSTTASVVLLLSSFLISWAEAWFLDFRVLPRESKAFSFLVSQNAERAAIMPHPTLSRSQSDDGSAFYSPPGSDGEDNGTEHDGSTVSEVEWLTPKNSKEKPSDQEYTRAAEEALQKALAILDSDGWTKEKDSQGSISSKNVPPYGKVFKYDGILNVSADKVFEALFFNGEEMAKWNPTVKKIKVIQRISEYVDIAHVIATEGAAGLVSSRDFVNVRIWRRKDQGYIHGSVATSHPDVPVGTKYVRGEQGPCAYVIMPVDGSSEQCKLQWLLNTNLKGWIPQYLIDQTLSTVMIEYVQALEKHTAPKVFKAKGNKV